MKSLTLSFGVMGRMIFPVIIISIASSIIWGLLDSVSAGYASYVGGSITAIFISLFGIRAALSLMGEHNRTAYDMLALYAVLYGVLFFIVTSTGAILTSLVAAIYAAWMLGESVSIRDIKNAVGSLQAAFVVFALSAKAIMSLVVYASISVVMAVPLASAARAAGHGTASVGYFNGFGRSFIPLFCVFAVSFFLQFFFGLLSFLLAFVPIAISLISIVVFQTIPDINIEVIVKGVAAGGALLWLQSWTWAASAVALKSNDDSLKQVRAAAPTDITPTVDLRALRKSRE